jgi:magnesium transporter
MKKRVRKETPPAYHGTHTHVHPHVTILEVKDNQITEIPMTGVCPEHQEGRAMWYDVRGLTDNGLIQQIATHFGLHGTIVEDIFDVFQRPKVTEFEKALFLKASAHILEVQPLRLKSEQVSFYLDTSNVLSFQEDEADLYGDLRKKLHAQSARPRTITADYMLFLQLDSLADGYFDVLDAFELQIDQVESDLIVGGNLKHKTRIHLLKRELNLFLRSVLPLRESVGRIVRSVHLAIPSSNLVYFRDLHDHLSEIVDQAERLRDQLVSLYDLYQSEIAIRTNSVVQVLTIVSTIFIPLTFIVGVYGMNFDTMPELRWRFGYPTVMVFMLIASLLMIGYFKRKRWL